MTMKLFKRIDPVLVGIIIIALLFTFLAVSRVGAQDATPTAPSVTITVGTPAPVSDLTDSLLTDVEKFLGTYGAIIGGVVLFVVQLLKAVPFLTNVNPRFINIGVSAVLVIGYLLATNFGYSVRYRAALDALPQIGQIVLGLLAAFGFSTAFYEGAKVYGGKKAA